MDVGWRGPYSFVVLLQCSTVAFRLYHALPAACNTTYAHTRAPPARHPPHPTALPAAPLPRYIAPHRTPHTHAPHRLRLTFIFMPAVRVPRMARTCQRGIPEPPPTGGSSQPTCRRHSTANFGPSWWLNSPFTAHAGDRAVRGRFVPSFAPGTAYAAAHTCATTLLMIDENKHRRAAARAVLRLVCRDTWGVDVLNFVWWIRWRWIRLTT